MTNRALSTNACIALGTFSQLCSHNCVVVQSLALWTTFPSRTRSLPTGARSATTRWRTVWGRCSRPPNPASPSTASPIPAPPTAAAWACSPTSTETSRSSKRAGTSGRACTCSTWEGRSTQSASPRPASLCRVQTPTSATTGTRPLSAKYHLVSPEQLEYYLSGQSTDK